LGRPAVALVALTNEPEPRKSNTSQQDRLHGQNHSMNSCRVGENRLDVSEVDS
jgi:hypothetical protein